MSECLERGGLMVRGALLPTAIENADPFEGQAHSSLVCLALVTLLLVIDLCPEGMPERFRGPCHERLSEERRTLPTPVPPGFLATAFRDRCDARIFLACLGGGEAFPLFAEGHEEAGKTAPAPGKASNKGKSGWAWARCAQVEEPWCHEPVRSRALRTG